MELNVAPYISIRTLHDRVKEIKVWTFSSISHRRFAKLSITASVCPRRERYIAVGQPRYPSPPRIRIFIAPPSRAGSFEHPATKQKLFYGSVAIVTGCGGRPHSFVVSGRNHA